MAVNTITGTTGNDLLQGQQLSGTQNLINGLAGNDTLIAATVADSLNGGAGNDSLSFGAGLTVNGAALVGGLGDDSFYANGTTLLAASYSGESGNDLFNFTAATNIASTSVRGGEGNDSITFVAGGATLNGFVATMGQGDDFLNFTGSTFVSGLVYGGKGNDTLQFGNNLNAVSVGSNEGADRIQIASATVLNSVIGAGKGHDIITTTALAGGAFVGNIATVVGGEGRDSINLSFGAGSTTTSLQVFGDSSGDSTVGLADFINFSANGAAQVGQSSVYGGVGADTITFGGITAGRGTAIAVNVFGGADNDFITFGAGAANSLNGGAGNDTLVGQFSFADGVLTAGSIFSGLNMNGGTGVDTYLLQATSTNLVGSAIATSAVAVAGINAASTKNVLGNFSDAGDSLILANILRNGEAFSATNFLNTAAQALVAQAVGGTASNFTGAFVYNITGGFTSVAASGFVNGALNIFEANGDTVIQQLWSMNDGTAGTTAVGGAIAAGDSGIVFNFNLSANLGIINNGTAGFISKTGVALNFGIYTTAADGRNGFTITVA